jgi:hypothetical protein
MPVAIASQVAFPAQVGQTGTFTSADVRNVACTGLKVVLDLTSNPGSLGSIVLTVQGKDQASGKYWTLLASPAITVVATTVYTISPGITAIANQSACDVLPPIWRVVVSGNGSPTSYTVGASMTP